MNRPRATLGPGRPARGRPAQEARRESGLRKAAGVRSLLSRLAGLIEEGTSSNRNTRAVRERARRAKWYLEGGAETVDVLPGRLRAKLPRRGPRISLFGFVVDLFVELAEGEDLGSAARDAGRGGLAGSGGAFLGSFACGPICGFLGGTIYGQRFGAEWDGYERAARQFERTDPGYLGRLERYRETGYAYTCEEYEESLGFSGQYVDSIDCER